MSKELSNQNLSALENFNSKLLTISFGLALVMKCEPTNEKEETAKEEILFLCSSALDTVRKDFDNFFCCVCKGHDFDC